MRPGKYEKEKVLSIKHSLYLFDTIQGKCEQNGIKKQTRKKPVKRRRAGSFDPAKYEKEKS